MEGSSHLNASSIPCLPNNSSSTQCHSSLKVAPSAPYLGSTGAPPSLHGSNAGSHLSHQIEGLMPVSRLTTSDTKEDRASYADPRQEDISHKVASVLVSDDARVEILECVVEGTFGKLYKGVYHSLPQRPQPVTVKTVTDGCSETQRDILIREAVMLVGVSHPNICEVLAILAISSASPKVLYRATQHGNMKRFLQSCGPLVTREVVSMGLQVLQAMAHLHQNKLLHCDIATRNCVVDANLHVMVGDCSLSRDLFPGDYHCLGDNNNRPIKWLAIEALQFNSFSPQSDVWAWGVLLWEIMTLGQQPYAEIDPFEMDAILRQGVRLAQPINCPDEMFQAMTFCWTTSPLERPTVAELTIFLSNFLQHLDQFVWHNSSPRERDRY